MMCAVESIKLALTSPFRRRPGSMAFSALDGGPRWNGDASIDDVEYGVRNTSSRQGGFTLVEMVMVTLVVGMLVITLGMMLNSGVRAFDEGRKVIDTLSSLRLTTERLTRELRTVRRDPVTPANFDFITRTATSVQFRRLENDGTTVTTVTIDTSGTNLRLAYNLPAGTYILSNQLEPGGLTLTYLQQDGVTPATSSNATVAFVDISLTLRDSNNNSYPQRTRVALRNRQ